jgi:hypothetical protein
VRARRLAFECLCSILALTIAVQIWIKLNAYVSLIQRCLSNLGAELAATKPYSSTSRYGAFRLLGKRRWGRLRFYGVFVSAASRHPCSIAGVTLKCDEFERQLSLHTNQCNRGAQTRLIGKQKAEKQN